MANEDDRADETESRRILDRVSREVGGGGMGERLARRARDHVYAEDVDQDDWAEYWGVRIGRVLGLILMVGLIVWLVLFVIRGG